MRVVVIGGYGNFGARICRQLVTQSGFEVIAAARDPALGEQQAQLARVGVQSARLDLHNDNFSEALRALRPEIVVHCAGPFQEQDYSVAKSACRIGAHYVDLSDGRAFVTHFSKSVDKDACAANVTAISGASSVPALSSSVVDMLATRFKQIHEICIAIAPGQQAPRGNATIAAVLGYAGSPMLWLRNGLWERAHGWQNLRSLRFAGLGRRWAAACDVPDLELLPHRYPGVRSVQFYASLELRMQHVALWLAASLHRLHIPLKLERYAPQLNQLSLRMDRFGGERGGMLVHVFGERVDGTMGSVAWHLTAPDRYGPEIPAMAAVLTTRKIAEGQLKQRGAFPCIGVLKLDDFAPEFARWNITTTIEEL